MRTTTSTSRFWTRLATSRRRREEQTRHARWKPWVFALSRKEERFLEAAVKAIIRRAAEVAQNPGAALPPITLADLPDRS